MNIKRGSVAAAAAVAALSLTLSACGSEVSEDVSASGGAGSGAECSGNLNLRGSGSSAQNNAMTIFNNSFAQDCGGNVDYTSAGSGQGVTDFTTGITNFGGTDSALDAEQAAAAEAQCQSPALNLPLVFGPIALAYNVPGADTVNLSGATIARVFNGTISNWNDPAIAAENPGATLPDLPIIVVFRSDESGTTQNFQRYLAAAATADWPAENTGRAFAGGTGQGVNGSAEVANTVAQAEGAIGYVEWSYATAQSLSTASVITSAGPDPVALNAESVGNTIAAATFQNPGSNDLIIDTSGFYNPTTPGAYPLVLATYEVVCSTYPDSEIAAGIKSFLSVAASEPVQAQLEEEGYAPIPDEFRTTLLTAIDSIQ